MAAGRPTLHQRIRHHREESGLNQFIMTVRFLFLISCSFSFAVASYGQMVNQDSLWKKLVYVNDTLRSPSESELNSLLKIESSEKKITGRPDSVYGFLLAGIGHLYYEQGDYL